MYQGKVIARRSAYAAALGDDGDGYAGGNEDEQRLDDVRCRLAFVYVAGL